MAPRDCGFGSVDFALGREKTVFVGSRRSVLVVTVPALSTDVHFFATYMQPIRNLNAEVIMRRRMYFVLPNVAAAEQTTNDLLLARIEERHIHCLGKRGMPMGELHEAGVLQKTDLIHGAEVGIVCGAVGGVLLGALFAYMPLLGHTTLSPMAIPLIALGGAVFGAWASSLVASSTPNSRLRSFDVDFAAGRILMMVDVPANQVERIRDLVARRHPEAAQRGLEPAIPAFP